MAVAKMNKLRLIGLADECDKVLDTLAKSGVFEASRSDRAQSSEPTDFSRVDRILSRKLKAAFAIDYLAQTDREATALASARKKLIKRGVDAEPFEYKPLKKGSVRRLIDAETMDEITAGEYELLAKADELEKISFRRAEIKTETAKLEYRIASLKPYEKLDLKFSEITDTKTTSRVLVYCEAYTSNMSRLTDSDIPCAVISYPTLRGSLALVVTLKKDRDRACELLTGGGYGVVNMKDDDTAAEMIKACEEKIAELKKESYELFSSALEYIKYFDDFKAVYDTLGIDAEKARAANGFIRTERTFLLEGWVPEAVAAEVVDAVKERTQNVCAFLSEPEEGDSPPTLVDNPPLIAPFEEVTNLYSPPAYGELDPNPFMAVFFFIFYGVMMADAGYGFIMTVAAVIALKCFKFEKGMKSIIAIIGISGISAIVWGLLLGGVFGIDGIPALWFNPIQQPLPMFGLSLGLGVIQIVFGYGLYSVKMFRQKKYFAGIVDVLFKITVIIGVLLILLNMLAGLDNDALNLAGIIILIASFVGIIATAGHAKPTVMGKIAGGFAGLYDLVNLVSDILSYARIFGLALASAAIALAFNTLGAMFFGIPVIGYVIGAIVLVPLHAVNLGLGLLSGYIHNARLQFIEFYGKFYDGLGHLFKPLGCGTKYIRLNPTVKLPRERKKKKTAENAA